MNAGNRGYRGKSTSLSGRTAVPDNFGNRKSLEEVIVPPDNIGNKVDLNIIGDFVHDNAGNCLEQEPSHNKSGILASIGSQNDRRTEIKKRSKIERSSPYKDKHSSKAQRISTIRSVQTVSKRSESTLYFSGEEYIAKLNADFAKLLAQKSGLAFSFSIKPNSAQVAFSEEESKQELARVEALIKQILHSNDIDAKVGLCEYLGPVHHFAVFFIDSPKDPVHNKEMIAALRQVVNDYILVNVKSRVNLFLVLANARPVIEEHLEKIGAKKK